MLLPSPQPTPATPPCSVEWTTTKTSLRTWPSASLVTQQTKSPTALNQRRIFPTKFSKWKLASTSSRQMTGSLPFTSSKRLSSKWPPSSPTAKPPTLLSNLAPESPRLVDCSKSLAQLVVPTPAISKPQESQSSGLLWHPSTVPPTALLKSWISP